MCVSVYGGQRTTCGSRFSLSTTWVLGIKLGCQALPVEPPYWPSFPFLFMTQQFKRPENQAGTSVGGVKMAGECARQCLLLDRRPQTAEGNCTGCGKDPVFRLLPAASSWPPGAMKTALHTEDGEGSWGLLSPPEAALL